MTQGKASPSLLRTYDDERAPIGRQIVMRANQSIEEFGPIFDALGLLEVEQSGCVFVRADTHVAWRSRSLADDPNEALTEVLDRILGLR